MLGGMHPHSAPHSPVVDVCVATYHRPQGLARLLRALGELRFSAGESVPDVRVVVVDNDPDGSARAVVDDVDGSQAVAYAIEPRRGIAQARNRLVAEARDEAEFLAFIDDDEWPDPDWLAELLTAMSRFRADAVAGPVLPNFSAQVPTWLSQGGFFNRPRFDTGTKLPYAATANVLVRASPLRKLAPTFDERLGLIGGEDTHFFMRFVAAGHTIVWSDTAVVHEDVPSSRATVGWLLQRAYRGGNAFALCERMLSNSILVRANRLARGMFRIVRGIARLLLSPVLGQRSGALHGLRFVANGAGVVMGVIGMTYEEYRQTHGS